jgi:Helix-turn-helix domain/Bacterial regulatory proteins, gntR family
MVERDRVILSAALQFPPEPREASMPTPEPASLPANAATVAGASAGASGRLKAGQLKYVRVAAVVRDQVADGTLRPGQPAPSGAALSRLTGYSTLTCRRALRVLIADGVLIPGPSRNARPRVAGTGHRPAERGLAAAGRALSAGLAARRRDSGLTQPGLAVLAGVSVTTIGHAETGRLWQSRRFWERADQVLGARGELLRLHDAYREAATGGAGQPGGDGAAARPGIAAGPGERAAAEPEASPARGGVPLPRGRAEGGPGPGPGAPALAYVMIVWGDGTVTTLRPPDSPARERRPA